MKTLHFNISNFNRKRILKEVEELIVADGGVVLRGRYDEEIEICCKDLQSIKTFGEWLHIYFILDGYFYNVSMDDNPFFPALYEKIKIDENGEYIGKRYLEETENGYISMCYDSIWKEMTDEEIKNHALKTFEEIKKEIINGRESTPYTEKKRVSNYYNNKYHYETITDKTRCNIYFNDKTYQGYVLRVAE